MKKIIEFIKNSLEISKNEAGGVLLLSAIICLCFFLTLFYSNYQSTQTSELLIKTYGETEIPVENERKFNNNYKKYPYQNKFSTNNAFKKKSSFKFDPNSVSTTEMELLGFPKYLATIVVNYRNKGGKFRFKEDMLRVYGMNPALYSNIEAFILLPSKTENNQRSFDENSAFENNQESFVKPKIVLKKTFEKFDINLADTSNLIALKGIGAVFAKRIIKYRDVLGGFYSINQIEETYGITPEAIEEIKKYAVIGSGYKKIRINQDKIVKHPYLNYSQIKSIQNYRIQHGQIKNIDELKNIKIIDEATIIKAIPYLDFN